MLFRSDKGRVTSIFYYQDLAMLCYILLLYSSSNVSFYSVLYCTVLLLILSLPSSQRHSILSELYYLRHTIFFVFHFFSLNLSYHSTSLCAVLCCAAPYYHCYTKPATVNATLTSVATAFASIVFPVPIKGDKKKDNSNSGNKEHEKQRRKSK